MVDATLSLGEYIKIIKKRKWLIIEFSLIVLLISAFVLFASFDGNSSVKSLVSLGNQRISYVDAAEYKAYFAFTGVDAEIVTEGLEGQQQVLSMLQLSNGGLNEEKAIGQNKFMLDAFVEKFSKEKEEDLAALDAKIEIYTKEKIKLREYIDEIDRVLYLSLNDTALARELIDKFERQVDFFKDGIVDDEINGQRLDIYPLYVKKLETDINRLQDAISHAEKIQFVFEDHQKSADILLEELKNLEAAYVGHINNSTSREEVLIAEVSANSALIDYEYAVFENGEKDIRDDDSSFDLKPLPQANALLGQSIKLTEIQLDRVEIEEDLIDIENAYSPFLETKIISNRFPSTAESIIKIDLLSPDEKKRNIDVDRRQDLADAKRIITSTSVLSKVIDKHYPGMSVSEFLLNHLSIKFIQDRKSPREVFVLPLMKIQTTAESNEKAMELNNDIVDSFKEYMHIHKGSSQRLDSLGGSLESYYELQDEVNLSVRILEASVFGRDSSLLKRIPFTRLKLLLADYRLRFSKVNVERGKLLNYRADVGDIRIIDDASVISTQDPRTLSEKIAFLVASFFAGLFVAIFIAVQYEKNWPEYKNKLETTLHKLGITLNHHGQVALPHISANEANEIQIINKELDDLYRKVNNE